MVSKEEYTKIVEKHSGKSPVVKDTIRAFFCGGFICVAAQMLKNFCLSHEISEEISSSIVSITLIFAASLLTAIGIFDKIGKFAGAGTLVPITGFSNALTSSAIEFKTEGFVFGTAAKMFDVAGPVIAYGTASSVIAGLLYFIFN